MSGQWLFIEPCDVWMFRESRPFAAGQSFVARSMFPPTPQTMQGVIRSHVLEHSGVDWAAYGKGQADAYLYELIGSSTSLGSLSLSGPFVARMDDNGRASRLVPAPRDMTKTGQDDTAVYGIQSPRRENTAITAAPFEGWLPLGMSESATPIKDERLWLDDDGLAIYLRGDSPKVIEQDKVYVTDERVGLALDSGRRTARASHLYHAHFVRPQPGIGLLVQINAALLNHIPSKGVINLGGESRSGYYGTVNYTPPSLVHTGNVKIVLLTPAWFSGGWQPTNGDWSPWVGKGARLVSMVVGKPQAISGWDVARREPKPLRHYVPAGSVYYFENATLTDLPFTETPTNALDHAALGFGAVATATWHYLD
jgi:CRISPR-associated protein Cmr3